MNKNTISHQTILDGAEIGILTVDTSGKVAYANRRAKTILNCQKNILGEQILDIHPVIAQKVTTFCSDRKKRNVCHVGSGYDGLELDLSPISNRKQLSHVTCLIRRLKDLQASAQHLDHFKNLRIQIETIFSLSNYGIWILDGEGVVLKVNQVAPKLIGLQEKDVERGHCPVKNHPRNCASFKYQPVNRYPQTQKTSAEFAVTHAVNTTQFYLKEKGVYGISVPVSSLAKFRK